MPFPGLKEEKWEMYPRQDGDSWVEAKKYHYLDTGKYSQEGAVYFVPRPEQRVIWRELGLNNDMSTQEIAWKIMKREQAVAG